MAEANPPYLPGYGSITKALDRLKKASTPEKFSQDFLATKLDMKGGGPKQVIPYLKRAGFLRSDGTPTDLYERFRNDAQSGAAAAEALRTGYHALYDVNEYIHDASDDEIRGVIVQVTGAAKGSSTIKSILGSFKALRAFADFDASIAASDVIHEADVPTSVEGTTMPEGLSLGYTINLHLPATSDIAVFNAIFKSLRENLLK